MQIGTKLKEYKSYILNLVMPAMIFSFITGTFTAFIVTAYKVCARYVINLSMTGYDYLRENLILVPPLLLLLLLASAFFSFFYKSYPNIRGGGIPTTVGILRGIISFRWLSAIVGEFIISLFSFLIGVPLGNEGPSVQMGTAIGRGSTYAFAKGKHRAWDRYSMTGGACAGFSVATGAPISGILFAIEEAHQRISPTIMIVASSSVLFATITSRAISGAFGISTSLFEDVSIPKLAIKELWIPFVVGIVLGIFGSIVLKYYQVVKRFFRNTLKRVPYTVKIFLVFATTLIVGLISFSGVSTGHALIESLFENKLTIGILIFILIARTTLTISANTTGICGGMFIPSLAIGAVVSAITGKLLLLSGLDEKYYSIILVLGIVATLSGFMKSPLTAIVFSLEALSCYENIISVIMVSLLACFITEFFNTKSINDSAMETRIEELNHGKVAVVKDITVTVMPKSFAIGKQIRDIFWPANTVVLSVKKSVENKEELDGHGGKTLHIGDILHIEYSSFDEKTTIFELEGIVGQQK